MLLAALAFVGACTTRAKREPPLLRLVAHEFDFGLPRRIPEGLTRVRLVNDGGYWHHALFARLDSTQTPEGYLKEIRAGADFPSGAVDIGGPPLTTPGDSSDLVMRFTPGRWIVLCTASGGGVWHVAMGMLASFEVVADASAPEVSEPRTNLTLVMTDETFEFPDSLPPGERWVRIENHGARWHECDILRLAPGQGLEDYVRWREQDHQMTEAPAAPVGGCSDFGPGVRQWSLVDFQPGRHLLVCDMPGDSTHWREFVVGSAR